MEAKCGGNLQLQAVSDKLNPGLGLAILSAIVINESQHSQQSRKKQYDIR